MDGLYFHLYRYKLYSQAPSRYEHRLHTINSVLFVPLVALLFCGTPRGIYLWLLLGLFGGSLLVEILDVLCEPKSRRALGGLGASEYLLHFLMSGLRVGTVLPLLIVAAPADWQFQSTAFGPRPLWLFLCGASVAIPGIGVAALHIFLAVRGQAWKQPSRSD